MTHKSIHIYCDDLGNRKTSRTIQGILMTFLTLVLMFTALLAPEPKFMVSFRRSS